MSRFLQLVCGDWRNLASVAAALTLAYVISRWAPEAAGWILALGLIGAAAWRIA